MKVPSKFEVRSFTRSWDNIYRSVTRRTQMRKTYKYVIPVYTYTQNSCSKFGSKHNTYCTWPPPRWNPGNISIYLIFLETRIIGLHFAADSIGLCLHSFNFLVGSVKLLFLQKWRFGRSRSSKVIDFWYQSKAPMRLPIGRHSNLGPIIMFHRFRDIAGFLPS